MYGSIKYGTNQYGNEFAITEEEIELYRPDLLAYLPPALRQVKEFKVWNNAVGYELALLNWQKEDLVKQCFIDTATWGLSLWEEEYALSTDINKSYEERREILKAKKRGTGTITKQFIKEVAQTFSGGEVEIIEHAENNYFIVKFIGVKGIPRNLAAFKDMLNLIKPSHLYYDFQYTCTVWNKIKELNLVWDKIKNKTWDEIRVYE
ncbi:uncharacterized protein YmfQ (DUF2313 family) [Clostridium tetanomorphum]|uniref:YmfQ family protein n=1 Tax=Clostridium tetanomorphum TaxID=1553 RepID=A0A923J0F8_CLOTT|nr:MULTISPECIES: YmfQ family protein [Clostridium]KAJ51102.1 phage-like element pbsx protein xkdT [Clostridium tetanomorphum DSM 665]MBC2398022.1 YmfQ family protein [Clostridium tetanomorphum]MBP1864470.1 uncharacterized protein YmfQ (DUF2313 family) [Clostridium tetanomorphum]NRS82999.1 uncharacterized protein YmfQ (DUF2313 family) [Clostridium tetanomorphum]NRZ98905.1 uncharacterized protein YmfQ (DUF2313 family) [Clostridium tetanomorphum]